MAEKKRPSDAELARMARQHAKSLQAAGVEWLPKKTATPAATAPAREDDTRKRQGSLFQEEAPAAPAAPAAPTLTPEQRRHELTVLAEAVAGCTRCAELAEKRTQTVFGVGALDAEICFIGEAPGFEEDRQGEPFVGPAGQLLNRIIAACGMKREDVFICNILRCRPPGNRQPLPNEAANCREWLERTLELVRPKYICCLGATAAQYLLGTASSIGKMRGKFYDYKGIRVMCTYHPAFLLRSPERKKDVWDDMKKLLAQMGRPVPGR